MLHEQHLTSARLRLQATNRRVFVTDPCRLRHQRSKLQFPSCWVLGCLSAGTRINNTPTSTILRTTSPPNHTMNLQRTVHNPRLLRSLARPAAFRPAITIRQYAEVGETPGKPADGASGKDRKAAKPTILSESPPKDSEASEDVKAHNRDMDRRADRPAEGVKESDVEGDKVSKSFWSGE